MAVALSLFGCKGDTGKTTNNNSGKKQQQQGQGQAQNSPVVDHSNDMRSYLTGEWVSKDVGNKRPAAVMISNQPEAPSPSGIGEAKVIYEAPAEGNYSTRLMGIFEDWEKIEKIGSIRSCRNCYVYSMLEFDAIYVHAGQSMPALELVQSNYVDNISTMDKDFNDVFFQTTDLQKPHNTFTSGEGILSGANSRGYNLSHSTEYKGKFVFNEDDGNRVSINDGETATYVYPGFSINRPWFQYNSSDGKYYRYQYKKGEVEKHVDAVTNQQLSVDNIILQYCDFSNYLWEGEETLYWNIAQKGSGKGKYITDGKAMDITWKKTSEFGITHYYDSKGKELTLNQGKTWVCLVNNAMLKHVIISSKDESETNKPSYSGVTTTESTEAEEDNNDNGELVQENAVVEY